MTRPEITQLLSPIFSWRHKKDKKETGRNQYSASFVEAVMASAGDTSCQSNYHDEYLHVRHTLREQETYHNPEVKLASEFDPSQSENIMPDIYTRMTSTIRSSTSLASHTPDSLQFQISSKKPILRHVQQSDNLRACPQPSLTLTSQKYPRSQTDLFYRVPSPDLSSSSAILGDLDPEIKSKGLPLSRHDEPNSCSRFIEHLKTTAEQALLYSEDSDTYSTFEIEDRNSQIPGQRARRESSSSDETMLGSICGHVNEPEGISEQFIYSELPKIKKFNDSKSRRPRPACLNLVDSAFHALKSYPSSIQSTSPTSLISAASTISTFSLPQTPATSVYQEQLQIQPNTAQSHRTRYFSDKIDTYSETEDNSIKYHSSDKIIAADNVSLLSRSDIFDFSGSEKHTLIAKMTSVDPGLRENSSEIPILKRYSKTLYFDATERRAEDDDILDDIYGSKSPFIRQAAIPESPGNNFKVKKKSCPTKAKCSYGLFPQV